MLLWWVLILLRDKWPKCLSEKRNLVHGLWFMWRELGLAFKGQELGTRICNFAAKICRSCTPSSISFLRTRAEAWYTAAMQLLSHWMWIDGSWLNRFKLIHVNAVIVKLLIKPRLWCHKGKIFFNLRPMGNLDKLPGKFTFFSSPAHSYLKLSTTSVFCRIRIQNCLILRLSDLEPKLLILRFCRIRSQNCFRINRSRAQSNFLLINQSRAQSHFLFGNSRSLYGRNNKEKRFRQGVVLFASMVAGV